MLPFDVTIPATVPQGSKIPEGLMNNPVHWKRFVKLVINKNYAVRNSHKSVYGAILKGRDLLVDLA
jgi:hypothetical protein